MTIKRRTIIILFVFIAVCLISYWFVQHKKTIDKKTPPEIVYSIPRQIQYGFTLQNKTNRAVKKAEFWTYAPVKQTASQRCEEIKASHPYQLIVDELGNQVLHFTFDLIPPYGTKIVTIRANLLLSDQPNPMPLDDPIPHLKQEKYIESDNAEIIRTAKKLSDVDPLNTAEKIFKWVAGNIEYSGYLSKARGALYALSHKKGDCTEYMYLFTALCRVNKIPARCIGGYICRDNSILSPSGYHNWSEFYHESTWRVVDPQNKIFMKNQSHYIAMKIFGISSKNPMGNYHRFRFKGDGLKVRMKN